MVVDIKMCRFDDVPWGFRLVGGADFEFPLTVVKVKEGSIAEEAGLCEGDVIVRINETAVLPLTHDEADKLIRHCGNVFYLGVTRENEELEEANVPKKFPIIGVERPPSPVSFLEGSEREDVSPESGRLSAEYLPDLPDRPCSVLSENSEIKLVEQEIAAVLSGESEVLKEHDVIGIFPKPGVCMTSDVLRALNEDATKTKAEKDKENKKWTTFLQKPDRPIPKSPAQIEAERRAANAYKVKIVKSAPRTPERSVSPFVQRASEATAKPEPKSEPVKEPTPPPTQPEVEEPPPADSELPNLEETSSKADNNVETPAGDNNPTEEVEKVDKEKESSPENKEVEEDRKSVEEVVIETVAAESDPTTSVEDAAAATEPERVKTEEELALERQLVDVQRQLAALSSLPSTIQATLDAVTKQLAELLPAFQLQQQQQPKGPRGAGEAQTRKISLEKIDEDAEGTKAQDGTGGDEETTASSADVEQGRDNNENATEAIVTEVDEGDRAPPPELDGRSIVEGRDRTDIEVESYCQSKRSEETVLIRTEVSQTVEQSSLKKQKRHDVIEELEEHLVRKNDSRKRSKRAFGPLTPSSERPLVLPGGRRWYRPKDAYNDEFIAETLSAQAELIAGTALGSNCGIVYSVMRIFLAESFGSFMGLMGPRT